MLHVLCLFTQMYYEVFMVVLWCTIVISYSYNIPTIHIHIHTNKMIVYKAHTEYFEGIFVVQKS